MRKFAKKKHSCLGKGLPFGKGKKQDGLTLAERDKRFKKLMCILEYFHDLGLENDPVFQRMLSGKELDHIINKGSRPDLRFDFNNAKLLDPYKHAVKTDSGEYTDTRSESYKAFINTINYKE